MNDLLEMIVSRIKINEALIENIDKKLEDIPMPSSPDCSSWSEIYHLETKVETIYREQDFLKKLINERKNND